MSRLGSTIRNDVIIQVRKNFYTVSLIIAVLVAVTTCFAFKAEHIRIVIPAAMLLLVGGTTLVFIGGLIMEEKEKGILYAVLLSPLRIWEYLWSKIISLTVLATLEVGLMVGVPLAWFHSEQGIELPSIWILAAGIILMLVNLVRGMRTGPKAANNPWGATTLEWATTSPPPLLNFATEPEVTGEPYDFTGRRPGESHEEVPA